MRTRKDLTGLKHGYITIKSFNSSGGKSGSLWNAICDCGNDIVISMKNFSRGSVKSCGCKKWSFMNRGKDPKSASRNNLYTRTKCGAKQRNIEWKLTKEKFWELSFSNCHYCGIEPLQRFNVYLSHKGKYRSKNKEWCDKGWILYNGLDRKDSNGYYSENNAVSCCMICNGAKQDRKYEEFINWLERISKRRTNEKISNI